jgi:hypothetical protein
MKAFVVSLGIAMLAVNVASCAQPPKNQTVTRAAPIGSRFSAIGKVSMHPGQPCAPQIMFDFRPSKSKRAIWLAANAHEENLLLDAVKHHRAVNLSGIWKRGKTKECSYVSVNTVEVQKSFWQR